VESWAHGVAVETGKGQMTRVLNRLPATTGRLNSPDSEPRHAIEIRIHRWVSSDFPLDVREEKSVVLHHPPEVSWSPQSFRSFSG